MSIKKNIIITISILENNLDEPQLDIKSCNDRTKIVLEPRAGKLTLDAIELIKAIELVRDFSKDNPVTEGEQIAAENVEMMVDFIDDEIPF